MTEINKVVDSYALGKAHPSKRVGWLDTTRAIAVFCIVLGHTLRGKSIYYFLYAFHVPLCIVVTGICYRYTSNRKMRVHKLFGNIYLPYLMYSILSIAIYALAGSYLGERNTIQQIPKFFIGMVYGNGNLGMADGGWMKYNLPLWYLPFLFVLEIVVGEIYELIRRDRDGLKFDILMVIVATIVGSILYYTLPKGIELPCGLETVLYLLPFFFVGRVFSFFVTSQPNVGNRKKNRLILGVGLFFVGYVMRRLNGSADYVSDAYGNNYLFFILTAAFLSIGICYTLSSLPQCKILESVGKHTLTILGLHKFFVLGCTAFLIPKMNITNDGFYLVISIVCAIGSVMGCLVVSKLIILAKEFLRK